MARLQVGDEVPAFECSADDGSLITAAGQRGRRYVLYFYPEDDTPGCTRQACALRDGWPAVLATGAELFGVSPDGVASHARFRAKYDLPYRLLADRGHRLADEFGVWVEKSGRGRTWMGNERTTFVIGADGRIAAVLPQVKPETHLPQLLEALAA